MKLIGLDTETTGVNLEQSDILEIGLVIYDTAVVTSLDELVNESPKLTILVHRAVLNGANVEALLLNANLIKEIAEIASEVKPGASEYRKINPTLLSDENNHEKWITDPEGVVGIIIQWLLKHDAMPLTNYGLKKYGSNAALYEDYPNLKLDDFKFYLKGITVAGKNVASFDIPMLRANIPNFDIIKIKHRSIDPSIMFTVASDPEVPNLETCMQRLSFTKHTAHRAVDDVIDVLILLYFNFKKNRIHTYLAVDLEGNVVDSIIIEPDADPKLLEEFKKEHKELLVATENDFHKIAVQGRLSTFKYEKDKVFPEKLNVFSHAFPAKKIANSKEYLESIKDVLKYQDIIESKQTYYQVDKNIALTGETMLFTINPDKQQIFIQTGLPDEQDAIIEDFKNRFNQVIKLLKQTKEKA